VVTDLWLKIANAARTFKVEMLIQHLQHFHLMRAIESTIITFLENPETMAHSKPVVVWLHSYSWTNAKMSGHPLKDIYYLNFD
jgi:hypothetical protein